MAGNNILKLDQPVRVGNFSSAPASAPAGAIYWDTTAQELFVANGSTYSPLALATTVFSTAVFRLSDGSDPTKLLAFDNSASSTGVTHSIVMPNANVDLGNLTNSNISASAAIAYSKLNLSASIVNADVNASAAIAYSKLNLSASIVNSDVSASAAIARSKLASANSNRVVVNDGSGVMSDAAAITAARALISDANGIPTHSSVTSAELGYVSGVTSAIQTQINNKISSSEKGANNGVATLDSGGKVPASQLPNSVMEYKGTWAASTNTPTLADGTGNAGDVYIVNVAGTQNLGSGSISFSVGDWIIYNGTVWQKSSNSDAVASVNGQTGAVVLTTSDISEGSNLYFTNERAQDAIGAALSNTTTISLTYNDPGNLISADVNAGSLTNTQISASAAIAYSKLALSNSIVNADINASAAIAYSKLNLSASIVNADVNASAAIAYSKLNLSTSIVNADISASAAIAYSKLNLSGSIVNADVNASAAIALSKLAALTANRALQSDGSGVISASSVTNTELGYVSGVTSAIQTQLSAKLSSVSQDTAPTLGGDLTLNGKALLGVERRGNNSTAVVQQEYVEFSLTQSTTAVASSLTFDSRNFKGVSVEYTISNSNERRKGRLEVVCNNATGADSTVVSLVDQSTETADILVSWSAAVNSHNIELSYTTGAGTFNVDADIKRFRS